MQEINEAINLRSEAIHFTSKCLKKIRKKFFSTEVNLTKRAFLKIQNFFFLSLFQGNSCDK